MKTTLTIGFGVAILLLVVSCEVSLWGECRQDHSWIYCMRVLGNK